MRSPRRRGQGGQSLVEFAFVLPIIVLVIASFIELGRAVFAWNTIANAARQGARVAAVNQLVDTTDCDESRPIEDPYEPHWSIRGCAVAAAAALGISPANVNISYASPPSTTLTCDPTLHVGCIATITVSYHYAVATPFLNWVIGSFTMTQSSQMPLERVFP
jgi:Flp pilus assembly protein TadG